MKNPAILIAIFCLTGCGIADHFNESNKVDQDEKDYRTCLTANVSKPELCDSLKEVWLTNKADFTSGNY